MVGLEHELPVAQDAGSKVDGRVIERDQIDDTPEVTFKVALERIGLAGEPTRGDTRNSTATSTSLS